MKDLNQRTIRGGFAKVCSQAASFMIRIGCLMVLGRLLEPRDFGLVGMVTAMIGVLNVFKDFGISTATVQRTTVTEKQLSALFWINILVGGALAVLSVAAAPVVASFYHEPRLRMVTVALAVGLFLNAAGVQHSAILQRQMRFTAAAGIEVLSLICSTAVGIGMAISGYGYWALVGMTVTVPAVSTICLWWTTKWLPGMPQRQNDVRSILRFGGTVTLNGLFVYMAYNLEKILLGRFWGAEAIGIYGRAYQLINIPTANLNSAVGGVAFAALSRVRDDSSRLKSYFLKCYSLVLAGTLPLTIGCALFADDLIFVVLGPKWKDTVVIFRLLAPTILVFALINPFSWLLTAMGMIGRGLKISVVIALVAVVGYAIGLPHGPTGVALAYSTVMTLWTIPHIAWCIHGTVISYRDVLLAVSRPLLSSIVAAALAFGFQLLSPHWLTPLPRLVLGGGVLVGAYLTVLLYVMGQGTIYLKLFRKLGNLPIDEKGLVTV